MMHGWSSSVMLLLTLAGAVLLIGAALHDVVARTVPNWVSIALALIGSCLRIIDHNFFIGFAVGLAVFACAAFCWRRGWLGGGDVKLLGGTAIMISPMAVFSFLTAMSISGAVLALIYLIAGFFARSAARAAAKNGRHVSGRPSNFLNRVYRVELRRMRRGGPLPYACAIAVGFVIVTI